MESLFSIEALIAFLTLTALELVLGIDNIIFISIVSDKLPEKERNKVRVLGLSLAVITRIALLLSLYWIMGLTAPLITIGKLELSGRDCILLLGGLFLIAKSTHEIHQKLEAENEEEANILKKSSSFALVLLQILLLDIVFSLDSVITAVGMVNEIPIMVAAILVSTGVMIMALHSISKFVDEHPTLKMLALSFLVLIGFTLIAEGLDTHIPKGYIYFAMAYALLIECLNIKLRKKKKDPTHASKETE